MIFANILTKKVAEATFLTQVPPCVLHKPLATTQPIIMFAYVQYQLVITRAITVKIIPIKP